MAEAAHAPGAAPGPAQSDPGRVPYIGSRISLISKSGIRYEGTLYTIDTNESTVALQNVRSFGTEGRPRAEGQISASPEVYEYIIFRGPDIMDLQVLRTQDSTRPQAPYNDPAIVSTKVPQEDRQKKVPATAPSSTALPANEKPSNWEPAPVEIPAASAPNAKEPARTENNDSNRQEARRTVLPSYPIASAAPSSSVTSQNSSLWGPPPRVWGPPPQAGSAVQGQQNSPQEPRETPTGATTLSSVGNRSAPSASISTRQNPNGQAVQDSMGASVAHSKKPEANGNPTTRTPTRREGGRSYGGRGRRNRRRGPGITVPEEDFDFESMNEKFDKVTFADSSTSLAESGQGLEPIELKYDKSKSFFDDLVPEKQMPREKTNAAQRRATDMETFGETGNAYRYRGYRGGRGRRGGGGRGMGRGRSRTGSFANRQERAE